MRTRWFIIRGSAVQVRMGAPNKSIKNNSLHDLRFLQQTLYWNLAFTQLPRLDRIADSTRVLPPNKNYRRCRPHLGGTPQKWPEYRASLDILSQSNDMHFAAFGTGVTGQGQFPSCNVPILAVLSVSRPAPRAFVCPLVHALSLPQHTSPCLRLFSAL